MHLRVVPAVAPAQVGVEDVAGEVVREQPLRALLDEAEPAQPREQLAGVVPAERDPEQLLGRHAGVRAGLERRAMAAAGDVGDEPRQQLADDVRRGGELRRRALPLGEDVDQQRERERVPVRELEHAVVQVVADARGGEQGARVGRREVAQRQRAQELTPARILAPAAPGRLAPGDHHERVLAQAGDEPLADPRIEAGRGLVGVEQQHAASGRGERGLRVVRPEQRR